MPLSRRDFLKTASLATAGATLAPRGALAAGEPTRSVVVINLNGGNDGLNTLVPVTGAQYDLYRTLRPTLSHDVDHLLPLAGVPDFRLNPAMTRLGEIFDAGRLAIVTGVGIPADGYGVFDHEASRFGYQSCTLAAVPPSTIPTGWLGRWLDGVERGPVTPGMNLGGGRLMLTGNSFRPVALKRVSDFRLFISHYDIQNREAAYRAIMKIPHADGGVGEQNRLLRVQVLEESAVLLGASAAYAPTVSYPETPLGQSLRECAKLVWADVGVRAMTVLMEGFDTHAGQNLNGSGTHDYMLADVSDSMAAFYSDLVNLGLSDRVLVLTISEFGRRVPENNDMGTDHGLASVCFAMGDMVHGGVYGNHPSLANLVLDGNLPTTTDFRSVYATALGGFLGADPVPILGGSFPAVPFL